MVVIFGEDVNQVDAEVYRLRNCGEVVKGAYDVKSLRYALRDANGRSVTVRILSSKWETGGKEFTLHHIGSVAVDMCFSDMGS